ncbi:MAG: cytochrome c [Sulfitobacter sp.]|uniref:cytochrome c n=2 Tax=Sulfitobacter sp. TaxID=1903071 RepID=UPI003298CC54
MPADTKDLLHMRPCLTAFVGLSCALLAACSDGSSEDADRVREGQRVYAKECAACHGARGEGAGPMSLQLDVVPPDLAGLKQRNDGYFPREFVSRFVMGQLAKDDPASPMPDFSAVGLRHVYPNGGADGEVLETDFADLLDYLEAIQW